MAAYRLVYDSRHLQADGREPGSAPEPHTRQSSIVWVQFQQTIGRDDFARSLHVSQGLRSFKREQAVSEMFKNRTKRASWDYLSVIQPRNFGTGNWLVAWHSGRTSVSGRRTPCPALDLQLMGDH